MTAIDNYCDLSIIIVNYNSTSDLLDCIKSIHQSVKRLIYEIIVVDNNSNDQSVLACKLREYSFIKFYPSERNNGFAAANNMAIRCAKGSILLLMNPDTLVVNGALEEMYEFLCHHGEVGIVGPLIINDSGEVDLCCARRSPDIFTEIFYYTGLANAFPKSKVFGHYLMTYWDHKTPREVELISGACMMIKKQAAKKVGYMDERFFLYGDDVEWCYRFRKMGFKIHFYPHVRIIHKGGKSTSQMKSTAALISLDSMYKFIKLYHGDIAGIVYRITMFSIFVMKSIFSLITFRDSIMIYYNRMLWALGVLKFDQDNRGHPIWRGAKMKIKNIRLRRTN